MPESIPITTNCCDSPPSIQPDSSECKWCKLTIFFDPADQTCGDCSFSTGDPNAEYHWAESNRSIDEVSPQDEEAGWHCEGPNCGEDPAAATGAYHISYHLQEDESCNHLLEKDEEGDYIYYPDLVVPYDIDAPNVEPTIGTYSWNEKDPDFCRTISGNLTYTGNGSFTGDVTSHLDYGCVGFSFPSTYSLTRTLDCNSDLNEVVTIPENVECDADWILKTTSTHQLYQGGWILDPWTPKRNNYTYSESFCDDESCSVCETPFYTGTGMFSQSCSGFNRTYYWVNTFFYPGDDGPYWTYATFTIN